METKQDDKYQQNKTKSEATVQSGPQWRSVAIRQPSEPIFTNQTDRGLIPRPKSVAGHGVSKKEKKNTNEIHFPSSISSNWAPTELRPVPAFYPLERSTRLVEDPLSDVVNRLSEVNRLLSVHAVYCNETASASLLTAENVEMQLSLWKTGGQNSPEAIAVELQRRKGDSIAFHRYSRHILDAAVGYLELDGRVVDEELDLDIVYGKKVQNLLSLNMSDESETEFENAILAIEIAHSLLMKDRMDARHLGLESLCLLTDPLKTGKVTALLASRVVLLGTCQDPDATEESEVLLDEGPFQEIRQGILSLVQFRRLGDHDDVDNSIDVHAEEEEHMTVLHNLALAVLANALNVVENEDELKPAPEEVARNRLNSASSICESFLEEAEGDGEKEILKTLIAELGKAGDKPHNACLSAKCIGSLCRASDKARQRAKELGAKTVVQCALEVGTRTHLKLEKECHKVMTTFTNRTD